MPDNLLSEFLSGQACREPRRRKNTQATSEVKNALALVILYSIWFHRSQMAAHLIVLPHP